MPVVLIERVSVGGGYRDSLPCACGGGQAGCRDAGRRAVRLSALVEVDFAKVHDHVRRVIGAIAPNDTAERFTGFGVRVIKGDARFKDRRTRRRRRIRNSCTAFCHRDRIDPALPQISGLDEGPYLTNESIFDLTELPQHLLVIGGGPIGLEMAQAFRRLGSEVTVLEAAAPLAKDDPECAADRARPARTRRRRHPQRREDRARQRARPARCGDLSRGRRATIEGTHLLVATGRGPTLAGLSSRLPAFHIGDAGIR